MSDNPPKKGFFIPNKNNTNINNSPTIGVPISRPPTDEELVVTEIFTTPKIETLKISEENKVEEEKMVKLKETLPRPLFGQNLSYVYQPDVTPLFNRYQNKEEPIDYSKAQCSSIYLRTTVQCVPSNPQLLNQWSLPFGAILRPFAPFEKVPIYNFGNCGVIRCFNCRSYINPFVIFLDDGRKWQCNLCKCLNQVHHDYYCPLDEKGKRIDIQKHPELLNGCIEFIAPKEYYNRTPQPAAFLFILEITKNSIESGMINCIAESIKSCLDHLDKRTQIGFITFDSTIHYYNLKKGLLKPQLLIQGDLQDNTLPIPSGLLVDLEDSKKLILYLLNYLKDKKESNETDSCLGSVLNCAGKLLAPIGGKICLFLSTLPNIGVNPLNKENSQVEEEEILQPLNKEYKELSLIYSKDQISVDLFIATSTNIDLSSIRPLSKYTNGSIKFYPGFTKEINGEKLYYDVKRVLTKEIGFEGVMRIRISSGLKIANYYGNTFPRSQGLLGLPCIDSDSVFGIEIRHESSLINTSNACIQVAILYTTFSGERRIRVQTMTLPVTSNFNDLSKHADIHSTITLMGKMCVELATMNGISNTRNKIRDMVLGNIKNFKDFQLPLSLSLLPLYSQSLAKSYALSSDVNIKKDLRIASCDQILTSSIESFILLIHPDLYSIHEKLDHPKLIPLSYSQLDSQGIYLMNDSITLYLWVGEKASQEIQDEIYQACNHLTDSDQYPIQSSSSIYFVELVNYCRKHYGFMNIRLIKQGGSTEKLFIKRLTEDKTSNAMGYIDFLNHLQKGF